MSRVQYDGKRLIPAPLVSVSKTYAKTGDGEIVGKLYTLTLRGTIVAWKGSPDSTGTFHTAGGYPADEVIDGDSRLSAMERKQEAIRNLFSVEGKSLEFQALDATQPMKCNPRIRSIEFAEGIWYSRCEYTITLEADELYPEQEDDFSSNYISAASESWNLQPQDTPEGDGTDQSRTFALSHTVSATGKRFYDETGTLVKDSWKHAQAYVLPRLGYDSEIALASGVLNLPSYYTGFNHSRTQDVNEKDGTFSVTESWTLASGSALETFDIAVNESINDTNKTITVNGTITGLEERSTVDNSLTTSKWANAQTKFTAISGLIHGRAESYSGLSIPNTKPVSNSITRTPTLGTLAYNYQFNNRPIQVVGSALFESITINDALTAGQSFASIFVLGRSNGPVLQSLDTRPATTRTLNLELVVPRPDFGSNTQAELQNVVRNNPRVDPAYSGDVEKVINSANPSNHGYSQVFSNPAQENWNPYTGTYSYSQTWTFE